MGTSGLSKSGMDNMQNFNDFTSGKTVITEEDNVANRFKKLAGLL